MNGLFDYPKATAFGRVLPKNKIYEYGNVTSALKERFVRQVDQITWKFKLASETLNIEATKAVPEIQVFGIRLKASKLDDDILRAIDKAIPFPIIFELSYEGRVQAVAAFKRPSEAESGKWVISDYFKGEWISDSSIRSNLPVALNLGGLYDQILTSIMPTAAIENEGLKDRVERLEVIATKTRDVARIKARLSREKQFNKRVAINAELRTAIHDLDRLTGETGRIVSKG